MSKLHVERSENGSIIVDEWGNVIASTPDDNEYLNIMALAPDLRETLATMTKDYRELRRAFYRYRESDGNCPLIERATKLLNGE